MASFSPDTWQLQISCQQSIKNFFNMIICTDKFSRVLLKSNAWQSNQFAFSVFGQKNHFHFLALVQSKIE